MHALRDPRVLVVAVCAAASIAFPARALEPPPIDAFVTTWHAYVQASRSLFAREVPAARWLIARAAEGKV
jgi:hypothetical protein